MFCKSLLIITSCINPSTTTNIATTKSFFPLNYVLGNPYNLRPAYKHEIHFTYIGMRKGFACWRFSLDVDAEIMNSIEKPTFDLSVAYLYHPKNTRCFKRGTAHTLDLMIDDSLTTKNCDLDNHIFDVKDNEFCDHNAR